MAREEGRSRAARLFAEPGRAARARDRRPQSALRTREAYLGHEAAKAELKGLMPEDAKEAIGHGIRAKRSKSGAVSFDVLSVEIDRAQLQ